MLKETPVNLRQAIVIGLGDVGETTIDALEDLLRDRLGGIPLIGLVTIQPDYALSASEIEVVETESTRWHVRLPMAGDAIERPSEAELPLGSRPISEDKPDTGVLDTSSDPRQLRRNGRQAIRRWGDSLQRLLGTIQSNIGTQDSVTAVKQKTGFAALVDETALEVFVVAALDEPFASGAFLDLAYLVNWLLSFEGGSRFHYHTSGIFYLPNYQWDEADPELRGADTYAALKELDFYTTQRRYASDFRTRLEFTSEGLPFNRSCFLVETTNDERRSLVEIDQLTAMVAEWLYRYLTSPLMVQIRAHGSDFATRTSEGRVTAYSGLGVASYLLPIDELIEACGVRLGEEIVRKHLQRTARGQERSEPMGRAQTYAGHPVAAWLEEALRTAPAVASFQDVHPRYFDNIPLWSYKELRDRVVRLFGVQKMSQTLPSIRRDLQQRAETVLGRVRQHLPTEVRGIIDPTPDGGLDRAQIFLEKLREAMADREQTARRQAKDAHNEAKSKGDEIARTRAHYQSATQMITPQGLVGMILATIVVTGLLIYASNILFQLLPDLALGVRNSLTLDFHNLNVVAGILLILGHIAVVTIAVITTINWMTSTKLLYIMRHRERLDCSLRKVAQDLLARFYNKMQAVVNDEIVTLTDFRDQIDRLAEVLKDELGKPRRLFGTLRFPLEESVLTPGDLNNFYNEIINPGSDRSAGGLDDFVLKLMNAHGPLSTWENGDVSALSQRIIGFGKLQMEDLRRRKSAEQILISHLKGPERADYAPIHVQIMFAAQAREEAPSLMELPPLPADRKEALHEKAQELYTRCLPFLRYNKTQIQADVEVYLMRLLGTHTADAEATPLNSVTDESYSKVQRVATQDPHSLIAMSVRHGMPLYALGMAKRYRNQYQRCYRSKLLHTRHDHLALPDLFPLEAGVLEPQMAVALGCAVKPRGSREAIIEHTENKGYYYVHEEPGRPSVQMPLGQDRLDACIHLQHNEVDLRRVSKQIDDAIVEQSERLKGGNQAVIKKLRKYLGDNVGKLEDWQVLMIDRYIERLH